MKNESSRKRTKKFQNMHFDRKLSGSENIFLYFQRNWMFLDPRFQNYSSEKTYHRSYQKISKRTIFYQKLSKHFLYFQQS